MLRLYGVDCVGDGRLGGGIEGDDDELTSRPEGESGQRGGR
jgi:hypothetical protein